MVTDPVGSGIFRRCFNILLYYKKVAEEVSGWIVTGRIKESLARALFEQPKLSGRLRRSGDNGHGTGLEIVSNYSGLRLIEAKIPVTLSAFLDLKESEGVEPELVFWEDVDEQNLSLSPLFYVQVTNFECGGYSIGISCSILLSDLLIMENFLKTLANIHNKMLSDADTPKTPVFYLPNFRKASYSPTIPVISSNQAKNCGQTMIFGITDENVNIENESGKTLMLICVEKTESELGSAMPSKFPVFMKDYSSNAIKIESCWRFKNEPVQSQLNLRSQVTSVSWDVLRANEIVIHQGNKPTRVTYWIGSVTEGLVMALTSSQVPGSGLNIIVTAPGENRIDRKTILSKMLT